jgi:hypothetical protein
MSLKGSRQWESRGVWNVSNCPNLARTTAIEVRFSLNFAVVFDFTYFPFRPSKAKWIGNVLPNRRENRSVFSIDAAIHICRGGGDRKFPVPSRDVTTKHSLGGNNDIIIELFLHRGSLFSDIPAGKLVNLFLRCGGEPYPQHFGN